MSVKPDFAMMTTPQLRAYVLEHRSDDEALQAYLDRRHAENPNSRVYRAEDDVSEAIAAYLESKRQQEAS
ncbi:DUF6887 family protein [Stenomitos frigidus]|uniref:Uncharacterized protein n=1 Tax=Stenomitos frigidus ULC18 TaxID=2107698 RepID=A0A2T1E5M8_9CYAN|nr:hypothetical protein [Stenomitos frigidus]PSB28049.1 hypothetical protein C7B82_14445 [Stenomitos frigidus ULC18]